MDYKVIEKDTLKYIEFVSGDAVLGSEQEALELIAACIENDIGFLMLHAEMMSEDFFKLRTGLAGAVLQKFMNYHITAAAIIPNEDTIKGKFKEMATEANKGKDFRVFKSVEEAEAWLLSL